MSPDRRTPRSLAAILVVGAALVLATASPAPAAPETRVARATERVELALTVYAGGFGLVEDVRGVELQQGANAVALPGVAPGLDLDSCVVSASLQAAQPAQVPPPSQAAQVTQPPQAAPVQVQVQADQLTLAVTSLSWESLLRSRVGQDVDVNLAVDRVATGRLVWLDDGGDRASVLVDGRVLFVSASSISLPIAGSDLPPGGAELRFTVNAPAAGRYLVRACYLTSGLGWRGDYSLVLAESEKQGELTAWANLGNQTGVAFQDARVELIAGEVRRISGSEVVTTRLQAKAMAAAPAGAGEAGLLPTFEYRAYQVPGRSSIPERGTVRVRMFQAARVSLRKVYVLQRNVGYTAEAYLFKKETQSVAVTLEISNRKEAGLGSALMAGVFKTYRVKPDGGLIFLGEDAISDTPKDRTFYVTLGSAFDVVAERVKTDYRKLTSDSYEEAHSIKLFNRKEEDVEVVVLERLPGDWAILQSSPPNCFRKADAQTAEFRVKVPKNGQIEILYRAKIAL